MKQSIYKKRALAPIISAILLLVVGVILVTIVLTWGKNFTTKNLDSATDFGALSASDASLFVFSKTFKEGVVMFTYSPPSYLMDEEITITHYRIVDIPEMTSVQLTTPVTLSASTNIVPLECLYEYSKSSADITIQFITTENKYIEVKTRDPNIVCTSGGTGTEEDPIIVCNAEDLNDIRTDLDANYALGKDIDLQCFSRQDVNGWEPIGTNASRFTGSLDGQNNTISNLYINRPETNAIGLFGAINLAEIKNLSLEDTNITGKNITGGLIGYSEQSNISNNNSTGTIIGYSTTGGLIGYSTYDDISDCYTEGAVIISYNLGMYGGGLIGIFSEDGGGTLLNSYSTATVGNISKTSQYMGGLIGYASAEDINNCYATGQIYGAEKLGGLIGYNYYTNIADSYATGTINFNQIGGYSGGLIGHSVLGNITDSYATGDILGGQELHFIGGLIGLLEDGSITDSYATGNITGDSCVGGLIGYAETGTINNSYSVGPVSGSSLVGGLVGLNDDTTFSNSFWNTDIYATSAGGTGKTTTEMKTQSTFTGWDFSSIWGMDSSTNSGYPYLRSNPPD